MEQIGKYRIESKLGEGAMGYVYKAWHPGFNDFVALKTIQDSRLASQELLDRFKDEGRNLARLKHQNIVQIYDADQADGVHFIVMEYMNGGSLDRIISQRENVPLAKRVGYIVPVCQALEYAHKRRLFHRDIKPANIMLHLDGTEEIVKVVDFGIARLVDFSHTQTKLFIGAPAYMAPELLTATTKANEKTDIWAVGVTLYELIAYRRPFEGNTLEELKRNIVQVNPKPLTQIAPDCPKDLAAVVEKALQKAPGARYQTVDELLDELEPIAKKLRSDVVANLARRAADLVEIGELESAKSALEEAKRYDGTNLHVRSLLAEVLEQIRRKELFPRLQELLRLGRRHLTDGQYRKAKEVAEDAIGLDSRYEPAQKLLAEIQEAETAAEEITQKITFARRCLSGGELTEASRLVDYVLSLDPLNDDARNINAEIRNQRQEIERRKRLHQVLRGADDLLIQGKFEECLALLEGARIEFPGSAEIQKRRETAQAEKSEQLRQSLLSKAKKFRASQQFDLANEALNELLTRFPDDAGSMTLRASVQKELDQDRMNKQLGEAWGKLHSLKHEGKLREALDLAKDLVLKLPSEEKLREFIREIESEIDRSRKYGQLEATIKNLQSLIGSGRPLEAIKEAKSAERQFPNHSVLISLRKEAESQQELQQIRERQGSLLLKVRQLISSGQFALAMESARKAIEELGEHAGLRNAMLEAQGLELARLEKTRLRVRITTEIHEACANQNIGEATRIFQEASKDGLVEVGTTLHQTLYQDIERARSDEQKVRNMQLERMQRSMRDTIARQEYLEAIESGNKIASEFGADPTISALLREAEAGLERKKRADQEQREILNQASGLLASGNVAAANLLLRKNIEGGILNPSNSEVAQLVARATELLEKDNARKKRVQRDKDRVEGLAKRGKFNEAIELGRRIILTEGHEEEIAVLVRQLELQQADRERIEKRKQAELEAIRGLIASAEGPQAMALLEDALRRRIFERDAPEIKLLRRQIEQLNPRVQGISPAQESEDATRTSSHGRRTMGLVTMVLILATVCGGIYFFVYRGSNSNPPPGATVVTSAPPVVDNPSVVTVPSTDPNPVPVTPKPATPESSTSDLEKYQRALILNAEKAANGSNDYKRALILLGKAHDLDGPLQSEIEKDQRKYEARLKGTAATIPARPPSTEHPPSVEVGNARPTTSPVVNDQRLVNNSPVATTTATDKPSQPPVMTPTPAPTQPVAPPPSQPATVAAATPPLGKPAESANSEPKKIDSTTDPSLNSADRLAIIAVIEQLSLAFSHRSMAEIQNIWPKIGADKENLKSVFDSAQSLNREFHNPKVSIRPDGNTATVTGDYEGKFRARDGKEFPGSGNFYVRLSKKNGKWFIDSANF